MREIVSIIIGLYTGLYNWVILSSGPLLVVESNCCPDKLPLMQGAAAEWLSSRGENNHLGEKIEIHCREVSSYIDEVAGPK